MVSKIVRHLRKKVLKAFMDMLILAEIQKEPLSGYDIICLIHERFDILVSSGTIYSLLYSLERNGLVNAKMDNRKRIYTLTAKGEQTLETVLQAKGEIPSLLHNLISHKK